jgi:hypothetical protein
VIPSDLRWFSVTFARPTGTSNSIANGVAWDGGEKRLEVVIQEKVPSTGEWIKEQYLYSTSYHVLDVDARLAGQVLYVSGIQLDRDGEYTDIIEEWTFPAATGSYAATFSGGTTTVGTPRASFAGTAALVGGTYLAPSERNPGPQPIPDKRVLWSERSSGHFNCIAADPEGRFLLLHNYTTGDVLSLDLLSSATGPTLVMAAAQVPALSSSRSIMLHDVPNIGRICRLYPVGPAGTNWLSTAPAVILLDAQNDGQFESHSIHPMIEVSRGQTVFGETILWRSVTNFGWDWQSEF